MSAPEPQISDMPIHHDFAPHVEPVARAGYEAHTSGDRSARTWDDLRDSERFRWRLTADQMVRRRLHEPSRIRAIYLTGYVDMPWADAKPAVQRRWERVARAMRDAWDQWTAEQRRNRESQATERRRAKEARERARTEKKQPRPARKAATPPQTAPATPVQITTQSNVASLRERLKQRRAETNQ